MASRKTDKYSLTAHVSEFGIPPVRDGLVVGKTAPIGFAAINKALKLLIANHFVAIEIEDDDVISHIIVRSAIIRRVPKEKLKTFVIDRIKPLMSPHEVLHLQLEARVTLEDESL